MITDQVREEIRAQQDSVNNPFKFTAKFKGAKVPSVTCPARCGMFVDFETFSHTYSPSSIGF